MRSPDETRAAGRPEDLDRRLDGFAAALRRWAERPVPPAPAWKTPSTTTPRPRRVPAAGWRWAAAALAAGALALALVPGRWRRAADPPAASPAPATASIVVDQQDVLVLWLDDETPLYLHLAPADPAAAERNDAR